jgi:hypothetical protein
MYLDGLPIIEVAVGYGALGTKGSLGYDGLMVQAGGEPNGHALSAHAPSCLTFFCGGEYQRFDCKVAINDDVADKHTSADFNVLADGRLAAVATQVRAGDSPRQISADIAGAQHLCLTARTIQWPFCHSVWIEPEVTRDVPSHKWSDALGRVEVQSPPGTIEVDYCIATVVSAGYEHLLEGLLTTLGHQQWRSKTRVVVFNIDDDPGCAATIATHGAYAIPCRLLARRNASIKSVLYSVASLVPARYYLCLDADTLVLGDLRPIFAAIDAHPPDTILVARDAFLKQDRLMNQLREHYRGEDRDLGALLGRATEEGNYDILVNDGVFAGSRFAMLALDNLMRNMSHAAAWVDFYPDHGWRNQFIFNLALARLRCAVELDWRYNLQMHMTDPQPATIEGRPRATWRGQTAHVLHFCGWGRDKYSDWRQQIAD